MIGCFSFENTFGLVHPDTVVLDANVRLECRVWSLQERERAIGGLRLDAQDLQT